MQTETQTADPRAFRLMLTVKGESFQGSFRHRGSLHRKHLLASQLVEEDNRERENLMEKEITSKIVPKMIFTIVPQQTRELTKQI